MQRPIPLYPSSVLEHIHRARYSIVCSQISTFRCQFAITILSSNGAALQFHSIVNPYTRTLQRLCMEIVLTIVTLICTMSDNPPIHGGDRNGPPAHFYPQLLLLQGLLHGKSLCRLLSRQVIVYGKWQVVYGKSYMVADYYFSLRQIYGRL